MPFADRSIALHALVLSTIAVLFLCAVNRSPPSFVIAAGISALAVVFAGLKLNGTLRRALNGRDVDSALVRDALGHNSYLVALTYAWSGAALLAIYPWSGLTWRHGWQYGAAMAFMAGGIVVYLALLKRSAQLVSSFAAMDTAVLFAALQGVLITGGIIYLMASGKVYSERSDWAANVIFMTGGGAIALLCLLEVTTHMLVRRAARKQA